MLVTPFDQTPAYDLGIIDKKGNELKKMSSLNSVAEKDAYSILHRMIFRIKRIIEKVPVENKKLASFAAALTLVKENYHINKEPIDLELKFLNMIDEQQSAEALETVNKFFKKRIVTFGEFFEEAPANNISATPGIAMPELMLNKKKKNKINRRGM